MKSFADHLRDNMLECPWKAHLHVECPGCGFQRSLAFLVEGNLKASIEAYPALLLLILLLVYSALHLRFKFKKGHQYIVALFTLNCVVILTNYALKFI